MDGFNIAIARSTLPQVAAERLRALIIEGILAPGARLNERELSEQLGLSRTPLREAFRLLAAEGLLLQLPNRGVQVVALSREDVCHAFEVMASLEGLGRRACRRPRHRCRPRRPQGAAGRPGEGPPAARPAGYYRVNRAIHDRLNLIAANPVLAQTYRTLNARLHALRFRSNLNGAKWDRAVAEHRSMLTALAARDGAGLRDLLVRHLHAKLQAVLETMKGQDKE